MTFEIGVGFETITCCSCNFTFALEQKTVKNLRNTHTTFYCPSCGRSQYFSTKTEKEKLKAELERERARNASLKEQNEHYQNSARSYKGHTTRIKNRIVNGVCPCCNRTFQDLQRHMKNQHPNYGTDPVRE